jgi:redox-sensitive bicupin YhaK (pirin superfamily)
MRLIISILICLIALGYHQRQYILPYLPFTSITITTTRTTSTFSAATTNTTTMLSSPQATFKGLPVIPPNDPSLTATSTTPRVIRNVFEAIDTPEGAGARVRRSVGTRQLQNFTPFLMLDHFSISPGAGFPDHPHRGQETITYLLSGAVDHEDFAGNKGTIEAGDLQFMTAGRGIVHAEMPRKSPDGAPVVGMQLWADLPASLKECEPRYRDLRASEIPHATGDAGRVKVKVISGRAYGVDSLQELAYTPVWLLDVVVAPGGTFNTPIPCKWNAFIYTLNNSIVVSSGSNDSRKVAQYHNVVLEQEGDSVVASVPVDAGVDSRFLLVAGLPLDQDIVQYGPFVAVDTAGIYKAMADYQSFANGFERAENWESEIGKQMVH